MSISPTIRENVRQRAGFACEYCGVSETGSGGALTVDHFQPTSKDGNDAEENLVYCCFRCNIYKGDYWAEDSKLFNPRKDNRAEHFWFSESGKLLPLTETGEFTIKLLRLNRQPLVTKRWQDFQKLEERQILEQTQKAVETLLQLNRQQRELLKQQRNLLEEQRRLLEFLFRQ